MSNEPQLEVTKLMTHFTQSTGDSKVIIEENIKHLD